MNKSKTIGILFVVLGLVVVVGSAYFIITYSSNVLNAMLDFVTTNDFAKLQNCGVNMPPQFLQLKGELTGVLLPFLYLGLPLLLVVLSLLMFSGGYYYCLGKNEDEGRRAEKVELDLRRQRLEQKHIVVPRRPVPQETQRMSVQEKEELARKAHAGTNDLDP